MWRSMPSAGTSRFSLVGERPNVIEQVEFEEALDTVARGLFIEGQPLNVDVRAFIDLLVRRGYHLSEFFAPEGPHAAGARMTDVVGWIQVTLASGMSDNFICLDDAGVNELVK